MPAGLIGGIAAGIGSAVSAAGVAGTVGALGAAVSAGTSIAGALGGGSTQSGDISAGQAQATAAQQQAYDEYNANETPFISTGQSALSGLADADGLNGATGYANALSNFQASPGYQYQLSQGLSAIDNGAAERGTLRDGNTVRAEEALGSNLANQDFGNYVGRLNTLTSLGQTATSALGSAGVTTGSGIAGTDTSAATAQAKLAGATSGSVTNALSSLAGNKSVQNGLTSLLSSPSPGLTTGTNGEASF